MSSQLEVPLVLSLCIFATIQAAGLVSDGQPPVPYLNRDGSIPASYPNQRVFLDPRTGDAVVLFDYTDSLGHVQQMRTELELSRHTEPDVAVAIGFDSASKLWSYDYTLVNGPNAAQTIISWWFKDLERTSCRVTVPAGWEYLFPVIRHNPDWYRLVVSANRTNGIKPGGRLTGVLVRSKLAPGLGAVYNYGASRAPSFPREPDDLTARQIELVYGFPYNYREVNTLLPNLVLPSSSDAVSAEYKDQLRQCRGRGLCEGEFAEAASAFLNRHFDKSDEKAVAFNKAQMAARRPIETEFVEVLRILFVN